MNDLLFLFLDLVYVIRNNKKIKIKRLSFKENEEVEMSFEKDGVEYYFEFDPINYKLNNCLVSKEGMIVLNYKELKDFLEN